MAAMMVDSTTSIRVVVVLLMVIVCNMNVSSADQGTATWYEGDYSSKLISAY